MLRLLTIGVMALVVAACSAAEPAAESSTTIEQSASNSPPTSLTTPATSTTVASSTTSNPEATTTTAQQIDVEISDGEIVGPDRFEVSRDDTFDAWVLSDVAAELHVHGYDHFFDLVPGVPLNVTFVADVPGIFEVELEASHTHVFDVEVDG